MIEPIFQMEHISKRFGATQALENVSMNLYPGEVHALIGENGAGKSTLIKVMTGIHQPDQGEILLDGKPIRVHNSQDAQAYGIGAIYQGWHLHQQGIYFTGETAGYDQRRRAANRYVKIRVG